MAKYTEENMLSLLAGRAERMLQEYAAEPTIKERVKNIVKQAAGRSVADRDVIFWPAGMLLLGLLEAGHIEACRNYLDDWIASGAQVLHTDDALTGYVLVRVYEACGEQRYKDAADAIYQFLLEARTDNKGAIVYNAARDNSCVFADGIGQTAMFLSHYGTVFGKAEALALAAMQISLFAQYGMDAATGLPYHAYEAGCHMKYGIIGWGRAVGWLLLGTSQYAADCAIRKSQAPEDPESVDPANVHGMARLAVTDCARDATVMSIHKSLLETALQYVRKDGTWSWLLPASEGPQDSSASGMIAYSIVKSLRAEMTDPAEQGTSDVASQNNNVAENAASQDPRRAENENRIADMVAALSDFVNGDRVFGCSAECQDIGEYRQQYGCYPWGQGAVLAALAIA